MLSLRGKIREKLSKLERVRGALQLLEDVGIFDELEKEEEKIIRCGDCKNYSATSDTAGNCSVVNNVRFPEHFCNFGKEKELPRTPEKMKLSTSPKEFKQGEDVFLYIDHDGDYQVEIMNPPISVIGRPFVIIKGIRGSI